MSQRKLARLILLLALAPLLVLGVIGGIFIREKVIDLIRVSKVESRVRLVTRISRLLTALQEERGKTGILLGGNLSSAAMTTYQQKSDEALQDFSRRLIERGLPASNTEKVTQALLAIPVLRARVKQKPPYHEVFVGYTAVIGELLQFSVSLFRTENSGKVDMGLSSLISIESVKESVGRFRGFTSNLLANNVQLSDEQLFQMLGFYTSIFSHLDSPALILTPAIRATLTKKRAGKNWREVAQLFSHILRHSELGTYELDPNKFFALLTSLIEDLNEVISLETEEIRRALEELRTQSNYRIWYSGVGLALFILSAGFLGWRFYGNFLMLQESDARLKESLLSLDEMHRQEMNTSGEIQQLLLDGQPPLRLVGASVACRSKAALALDGDFVEFFPHSPTGFDLLFGDVMGKGVSAGLIGASVKNRFYRILVRLLVNKKCPSELPSTVEIMQGIHRELTPYLETLERFVCVHLARFDLEKRELRVVNAGHTIPLHLRPGVGLVEFPGPTNKPFGLFEGEVYEEIIVSLEPGDLVVFFSDGLPDTRSPEGTFFGRERMVREAMINGATPNSVLESLFSSVEKFARGRLWQDDLSCIVVQLSDQEAENLEEAKESSEV